jgi:hypothetical protein
LKLLIYAPLVDATVPDIVAALRSVIPELAVIELRDVGSAKPELGGRTTVLSKEPTCAELRAEIRRLLPNASAAPGYL